MHKKVFLNFDKQALAKEKSPKNNFDKLKHTYKSFLTLELAKYMQCQMTSQKNYLICKHTHTHTHTSSRRVQ